MYNWNWDWVWSYKSQLLHGAWLTLWINIAILLVGTCLGVVLGLIKRSRFPALRILSSLIIDFLRTMPVLVLLIWVYFCVPVLFKIKMDSIPTAIIVLSLNLAAFIAEIVDSGIEAVPQNHIESGTLLGLSRVQNLKYITLPLALRNMTPPIVGQYINTVKLSVLASVISVPELLNITQDIITQTFRPLEFYTVLAIIFLIILLPGTIWSKRFELKNIIKKNNLPAN